MENLILIGGGGHCKSVIDAVISQGEYCIVAILDNENNIGKKICGFAINYTDDDLQMLFDKGFNKAFVTLGSTGKFNIRRKLYEKAKEIGFSFPVICDPSAVVSTFAVVEDGVFIGKSAVINADAMIHKMSIINTGAIIEHESKIGEYTYIATGVVVAGNTQIENDTYIGAGTTVIQGISIGEHCMIGAGSVIVRNIEAHKKAYGVPCREVAQW